MVLKCPSWSYRLMVFVSCQADALFWRGCFISSWHYRENGSWRLVSAYS
jgi:hypothetical protein